MTQYVPVMLNLCLTVYIEAGWKGGVDFQIINSCSSIIMNQIVYTQVKQSGGGRARGRPMKTSQKALFHLKRLCNKGNERNLKVYYNCIPDDQSRLTLRYVYRYTHV